MDDIKHCSRCGAVISDLTTADYFSHIRIKYCDACREQVRREQAAVRVHNLRQRRRQKNKLLDERLELLEEENRLLRERITMLRQHD